MSVKLGWIERDGDESVPNFSVYQIYLTTYLLVVGRNRKCIHIDFLVDNFLVGTHYPSTHYPLPREGTFFYSRGSIVPKLSTYAFMFSISMVI